MTSIGEKIKFFRKREGVSQQELELKIQSAAGSISKIESGINNPTKETIYKIADALKLNRPEKHYLLTTDFGNYTSEEIKKAINEVKDTLTDPHTLAYLLDDNNRVVALSQTFQMLFKMSNTQIEEYTNANLLEVMVKPDSPGYKFISKDAYNEILKRTLTRIIAETPFMEIEEYWQELIPKLMKYPHFKKIWKEIKSNEVKLETYTYPARRVDFDFNGTKIPLYYSYERLISNPGFHLIIYTPNEDLIKLIGQST